LRQRKICRYCYPEKDNNMEIVDYFFGNFWHFLELVLVLDIVFSGGLIRFIKINANEKETEK